MRIALLISVVGKIKRGGESTTIGLVSFLSEHAEIDVIAGGSFPFNNVVNLGFPEHLNYETFYERLPKIIKYRILRRDRETHNCFAAGLASMETSETSQPASSGRLPGHKSRVRQGQAH